MVPFRLCCGHVTVRDYAVANANRKGARPGPTLRPAVDDRRRWRLSWVEVELGQCLRADRTV